MIWLVNTAKNDSTFNDIMASFNESKISVDYFLYKHLVIVIYVYDTQ